MNRDVELTRSTWSAAAKLAAIVSAIAVLAALAVSAAGDVPQAAVVLPVIVVAFTASWIQTGRARHELLAARADTSSTRRTHADRQHTTA